MTRLGRTHPKGLRWNIIRPSTRPLARRIPPGAPEHADRRPRSGWGPRAPRSRREHDRVGRGPARPRPRRAGAGHLPDPLAHRRSMHGFYFQGEIGGAPHSAAARPSFPTGASVPLSITPVGRRPLGRRPRGRSRLGARVWRPTPSPTRPTSPAAGLVAATTAEDGTELVVLELGAGRVGRPARPRDPGRDLRPGAGPARRGPHPRGGRRGRPADRALGQRALPHLLPRRRRPAGALGALPPGERAGPRRPPRPALPPRAASSRPSPRRRRAREAELAAEQERQAAADAERGAAAAAAGAAGARDRPAREGLRAARRARARRRRAAGGRPEAQGDRPRRRHRPGRALGARRLGAAAPAALDASARPARWPSSPRSRRSRCSACPSR